jgi:hypothetical protein
VNHVNIAQLKTDVSFSLMKSVQATAETLAATMLEDFAKTQANIQQAANAPHPTLGKHVDVRV